MSITQRIRYGAAELKSAYNRNLALALAISVAVHAAAIGLFVASAGPAVAGSSGRVLQDTIITVIDNIKPDDPILDPLPEPKSGGDDPIAKGGGRATQSATKVAAPLIVDDNVPTDTFATTDDLPHVGGTSGAFADSGNGGGDGSDPIGGGGGDGDPKANGDAPPFSEPIDATTEFRGDVTLPDVNMADITARVIYPRIARENGVEGTVTVKALIGVDGMPEEVNVLESSNRILEQAAIDAVAATRFSPGRLNDDPIRVWIRLPIRFEIR